MIKEFSEIIIVTLPSLDKIVLDHQRRWVFRILSKKSINLTEAAALYPPNGEIRLGPWSDFLISQDLDVLYDLAGEELTMYFSGDRQVVGRWRKPQRVRSKVHGPGQIVLLFNYSEPE